MGPLLLFLNTLDMGPFQKSNSTDPEYLVSKYIMGKYRAAHIALKDTQIPADSSSCTRGVNLAHFVLLCTVKISKLRRLSY